MGILLETLQRTLEGVITLISFYIFTSFFIDFVLYYTVE